MLSLFALFITTDDPAMKTSVETRSLIRDRRLDRVKKTVEFISEEREGEIDWAIGCFITNHCATVNKSTRDRTERFCKNFSSFYTAWKICEKPAYVILTLLRRNYDGVRVEICAR